MARGRWIAGIGLGALVAAGCAIAPAIGAAGQAPRVAPRLAAFAPAIGSFTPASADPRLAAVLARGGLDGSGFRFTPAETWRAARAVTVAVRALSGRTGFGTAGYVTERAADMPASVALAPIAYTLGLSVGWKKFAATGDVAKVDLAAAPGGRHLADLAATYGSRKVSARVQPGSDRGTDGTPRLIAETPTSTLDVAGSYSLSRNLDVTAGLRYRSERDRLQPLDDARRDSQAVYIGTAFRF